MTGRFWLLKSEPSTYSIADLERDGHTAWDGVRNYRARNLIRDQLAVDDLAIFYHSSVEPPGAAGLLRIAARPVPDRSQFDARSPFFDPRATRDAPRWWSVEVAFVERFATIVPLGILKEHPELSGMMVTQRGARLSIQPVEPSHFRVVLRLARARLHARTRRIPV
ncbi:MAG: EVE domain-containing protein [Polyangiaceae bacterium]|nr:EVE domain-containing protein [Polyangiaceae bacterium]